MPDIRFILFSFVCNEGTVFFPPNINFTINTVWDRKPDRCSLVTLLELRAERTVSFVEGYNHHFLGKNKPAVMCYIRQTHSPLTACLIWPENMLGVEAWHVQSMCIIYCKTLSVSGTNVLLSRSLWNMLIVHTTVRSVIYCLRELQRVPHSFCFQPLTQFPPLWNMTCCTLSVIHSVFLPLHH